MASMFSVEIVALSKRDQQRWAFTDNSDRRFSRLQQAGHAESPYFRLLYLCIILATGLQDLRHVRQLNRQRPALSRLHWITV
jgi:hypothetical protein